MRDIDSYEYDLFLSWTGTDREIKNQVKDYFISKYGEDFRIYDSDEECRGKFRDNYSEALVKSKVYLVILTDNLRRTTRITEVTRECDLACNLEAYRELNIEVLCLSQFFKTGNPAAKDINDALGWYFFTALSGHSYTYGNITDGLLAKETLEKLDADISGFIKDRNEGHPAIPQKPNFDIKKERLSTDDTFRGRQSDLENIRRAFMDGAKVVVLSGMGGIGKTKIAEEFARLSEKENLFKCLQIVHVQELTQEQNGMNILVSETKYENALCSEIISLNQSEQYKRKLCALQDLPEYVLLVLDNFNTVSQAALKDIIDKLNCRILVTTRVNLDDNEFDKEAKLIHITKMPLKQALEMFKETSGRDIGEDDFAAIYEKLDGHTITLCIMAKILRAHNYLSLKEISDTFTDINDMSEKVEFAHNFGFGGFVKEDTVLGHLKKLFDLTNLDDKCLNILQNMSLLSDGRISSKNLMSVMNLKNENELNLLKKYGWLEQYSESNTEYLYLHPILSQLVFNLDKPNAQNSAAIIGYLCNLYDSMRDRLHYSDAHFMENKLYYALFKLASSDNSLNPDLWDRFVDISHLLGELDELKKQTESLSPRLLNEENKELVESYYDMVVLEQHPADISIIEKYIDKLRTNARNYKWILRSLSVTLKHIGMHPDYRQLLQHILHTAMNVAQEKRDDLAVMNLSIYYLITDGDRALKSIKHYIKLRKSEGIDNGYIIYLRSIVNLVSRYGSIEKYMQIFLNLGETVTAKDFKFKEMFYQITHPVWAVRMKQILISMLNLPEDDRLYFLYDSTINTILSLANEEKINVQDLFDAAVKLYQLNYESGLTLAPVQDCIVHIVELIKNLPDHFRGELKQIILITDIDSNRITISNFSRLNVACLINANLQDETAVEQSRLLLETERKWYAKNHYAIVEALIRHGDTCEAFGLDNDALNAYCEAYDILKSNAEDSTQLAGLCKKILSLESANYRSLSWLNEVKDTALRIKKDENFQININSYFILRIRDNYINLKGNLKKVIGNISDAEINSFIKGLIPRYVEKVLSETVNCELSPSEWDENALNKDLSEKVYPDECTLELTRELLDNLSKDEISDLISAEVLKSYDEKIINILQATDNAVNYHQIERNEIIRMLEIANQQYEQNKLEYNAEQFEKVYLYSLVSRLLKGRITLIRPKKPIPPISLPLKELKEKIQPVKPLIDCAKSETAEIPAITLEAAKNIITFYNKTLNNILHDNTVSNVIEAEIEKLYKIKPAFFNAMDYFINLGENYKSYNSSLHTTILFRLIDNYIVCYNHKIAQSYIEKNTECMKLMQKSSDETAQGHAKVAYYHAKGDTASKDELFDAAIKYYKRSISNALKYKSTISNFINHNLHNIISLHFKRNPESSGINALLKCLLGENNRFRKKIDSIINRILQASGQNKAEAEKQLFYKLYSTSKILFQKNYNISNQRFLKITESRGNRSKLFYSQALENILADIEDNSAFKTLQNLSGVTF